MKNYYHVLGLDDKATLEDIKMAYKEYALKFHLDKHNNDSFFTERFIEVQEAYDFLVSTLFTYTILSRGSRMLNLSPLRKAFNNLSS